MANLINGMSEIYPWTKMHFLITIPGLNSATALFSEATGMEATADVIEFRQGNSASFSPMKVPGLVKHGNVTLKFGYTETSDVRNWAYRCLSDERKVQMDRQDVYIELLDVTQGISEHTKTGAGVSTNQYILKDAWVCKYTAPDLNATASEIAIETIEIAFERLVIPAVAKEGTNA